MQVCVARVYVCTPPPKMEKSKSGKVENWKSGALAVTVLFVLMSIEACDHPLKNWKTGKVVAITGPSLTHS